MALALRSPYDREIARLAWPALGALAADPLVSLVDTAFVGRLGVDELGALGVASALFGLAFILFNFLAYGTTPLVANAIGRGDRPAAARVVATGLMVAVVVGAAVVVALELAAVPALRLLGAEGQLLEEAGSYVRIRALAAPAVLIVTLGNGAYRGYQDTRTPLIVTLGLNAVNLVLDPLLIFGAGWGLVGAATATAVAQWLGAAWFVLLIRRGWRAESVRPRLVAGEVRAFLRVGRDVAVRTLALLAALTLATAVAARVSDAAVAAHQVMIQLFVFLALTVDALAIAAQAIVGRMVGEGGPWRRVSDRLLVLGLGVGLVLAAALLVLAGWLPGWFSSDQQVREELESVVPLLAALQPVGALVFVWDGVLIGAGAFAYLAAATALATASSAAMLALVLPLGLGLEGVWWGVTVLVVVRWLTLAWWYWGRRRVRR